MDYRIRMVDEDTERRQQAELERAQAALAKNVLALAEAKPGLGGFNKTRIFKATGVGMSGLEAIKDKSSKLQLDNLVKLADYFGVEPWQLLHPEGLAARKTPPLQSPLVAEYAPIVDQILREDPDPTVREFAKYMLTRATASPPRKSAEIFEIAQRISEICLPT